MDDDIKDLFPLPLRFSAPYNRYSAACQAYQARLFGRRVESAELNGKVLPAIDSP